jgi:hypothetical protein
MAKLYGKIKASELMTFDKSFARSNGQPLDSTEVFYSLTEAQEYASTDVAYIGQKIVVIETANEETTVTHYSIEADNSLKELGVTLVGDGLTVEVIDGKISLVGMDSVSDTTKKYQPVLTNGKLTWQELSDTTVEGLDASLKALESEVDTNTANIDLINNKIGEVVEGKTVIEMINEAQEAATYDDTEIIGLINDNTDAIATLCSDATVEGSVDKKITDSINDFATKVTDNGTIDTFKELVDYVGTHGGEAAEMASAIETLETKMGEKSVQVQIDEAINAKNLDQYATDEDVLEVIERVELLEDESHKHDNKTLLDTYTQTEDDLSDAVAKKHEHSNGTVLDTITADKIASWDEAEKNIIASIDDTQFNVDADRKLTLLDIDMGKITGLADTLEDKADKGTTLAEYGITDAYTKTETEGRIQEVLDGLSDTSETAASVAQALETYKTSNDQRVDTIEGKLSNIADGAQVNVLEAIKINGVSQAISDKTVDIPIATDELLGVVIGSDAENKVAIANDGTMEVNSINVNKLIQSENEFLILNGGSAKLND